MNVNFFTLILIAVIINIPVLCQTTRKPIDSIGFSWNLSEMNSLYSYLDNNAHIRFDTEAQVVAAICPHDDYLYASDVYYSLFSRIFPSTIIIIGVTHATVRKQIDDPVNVLLLENYAKWAGCQKEIAVSPMRDYLIKEMPDSSFLVYNKAHQLEHSIEALIPFIQKRNPKAEIVPIMVTRMQYSNMQKISGLLASAISKYCSLKGLIPGKDVMILISSDANHYGPDFSNTPFGTDTVAHTRAVEYDKSIADECLTGEIDELKIKRCTDKLWFKDSDTLTPVWCGKYSVPFGLLTARKISEIYSKKLFGEVLMYNDSWSKGVIPVSRISLGTTAPFSLKHWVGYLSAIYSLK
ncbi:MAG: AmmeMemoRadiSam system protein B [Ignavibacteria bacterium]|nr:AmmeMemoRadiSam system protein B [Ignavibacteria bacterium]